MSKHSDQQKTPLNPVEADAQILWKIKDSHGPHGGIEPSMLFMATRALNNRFVHFWSLMDRNYNLSACQNSQIDL